MTADQITHLLRETFIVTLELAAPFLLLALVVGILFSLLQSFVKMQDITLTFVPKMLIVGGAIAICFPWILKIMIKFTHYLFLQEWSNVVQESLYVLPAR